MSYQYTDEAQTIVRHTLTGETFPINAVGNRHRQRYQRWLAAGNTPEDAPIETEPPEETRRREAITSLVSSVQNVPLSELTAAHIRTIVILLLLWHRFIDLDDQGRVVVRFRQQ